VDDTVTYVGALMATGDVIAQTVIDKKSFNAIEWTRVGRFAFIGATLIAPSIRVWYLSLERMTGSAITIKATVSKLALDQVCFAPIFQIPVLTYIGILQGHKLTDIKTKVENEWADIVLTGWKIWPAAQVINFYFVPFLIRPLFAACVALIWNTFLAWKANSDQDTHDIGGYFCSESNRQEGRN